MDERIKFELKKVSLLAFKIAIGSSLAYYIAERILHLQFASSAGIVTLLTLQTTKRDTIKMSLRRLFTFFLTYGICFLLYHLIDLAWFDYGIYLLIAVFLYEWFGLRKIVSANAVTATHFLSTQDFSFEFMLNELLLVIIGITIAIILNMFHIYNTEENNIIKCMRHVENDMKNILLELAGYLKCQSMGSNVWNDMRTLEGWLDRFSNLAHDYQGNTFVSHPEYYINYFRMRKQQCVVLHNLHSEMRRLRKLPEQANIIAEYIMTLTNYITEMNDPEEQMKELNILLENMKSEPLPKNREEFESRALLYHILMDLEDFLLFKRKFIESIDEEQFRIYWNKQV